jgi:hypothetical protein
MAETYDVMRFSTPRPTELTLPDVLKISEDTEWANTTYLEPEQTLDLDLVVPPQNSDGELMAGSSNNQVFDNSIFYELAHRYSQYQLIDNLTNPLSYPFELESKPTHIVTFDPDGDGDDELFIQTESGQGFILYNIMANAAALTFETKSAFMTHDVRQFFDSAHEYPECHDFTDADKLLFFKTLRAPYLFQEGLENLFSTQPPRETPRIDRTTYYADQFQDLFDKKETTLASFYNDVLYPFVTRKEEDPCYTWHANWALTGAQLTNDFRIGALQLSASQLILNNVDHVDAGLGMTIYTGDGNDLIVGSILPESPAEKAGIKPGDQILKINGVSLKHIPQKLDVIGRMAILTEKAEELRQLRKDDKHLSMRSTLLGPKNSLVDLTFYQNLTSTSKTVTLKRSFSTKPHLEETVSMHADGIIDGGIGVSFIPRKVEIQDATGTWMTSTVAFIDDVVPDSPAEKAGLQKGDYITRVNGDDFLFAAAKPEAIAKQLVLTGQFTETLESFGDTPMQAYQAALLGPSGTPVEVTTKNSKGKKKTHRLFRTQNYLPDMLNEIYEQNLSELSQHQSLIEARGISQSVEQRVTPLN